MAHGPVFGEQATSGDLTCGWQKRVSPKFPQMAVSRRRHVPTIEDQRRARESLRSAAGTVQRQGVPFCEGGETRRGLLWLVRSLKRAPESGGDLRTSGCDSTPELRGQLLLITDL